MLYSKFKFCNCDFSKFWCGLDKEFSTLLKCAFEVIIPFQDTYMCEAGFSKTIKRRKWLWIRLSWCNSNKRVSLSCKLRWSRGV